MTTSKRPAQSGFTLVELAIVMIIIGLLIGGVLKGQALITNAQVTATVAQLKAISAASNTFKDTYNALPGDITTPGNSLPNCTAAPCNTAGNGNGHLDNLPNVTPIGTEGERYFVHLNAAGLLTGITPGAAGSTAIGANFPGTKINGAVILASSDPVGTAANFNAGANLIGANNPSAGLYLTASGGIGVPSIGITADQALRIDTKLDDGAPDTGDVRAFGGATCGAAGVAPVAGTYATSNTGVTCGLYVRSQ